MKLNMPKRPKRKSPCFIRLTFAFAVAVNAARNCANTLLIECGIALGGLGVLDCVYSFMQTHALDSDTPYLAELKNRLRDKGIELYDEVTGRTWHNPEILAEIS